MGEAAKGEASEAEIVRLVFDAGDFQALLDELAQRCKAFGSFESIPDSVRSPIEEALAGRGFEFTYADDGPALNAGERTLKVRIGGRLHGALATLRAMQGDDFV